MDVSLLIRLLCVFLFAWVAWSDYRTRTAPNEAWAALFTLGVVALALEYTVESLLGVAMVAGVVWTLAIAGFAIGTIGAADAKAIMVLPIIYPRMPHQPVQSGVSGGLTQGVEPLKWVYLVGGVLWVCWVAQSHFTDGEAETPLLLPIAGGVLSLFVLSFV